MENHKNVRNFNLNFADFKISFLSYKFIEFEKT